MLNLHITKGDLTDMDVDAIVNAANNDLVLGGGLAGVIRRKGGPDIQAECDRHGPIEVGGAAITGAGRLKARYVIHAASMGFSVPTTEDSLRSSTVNSLKRAEEQQLGTIAFPAIGTGIANFPVRRCAEIMLDVFLHYQPVKSSIRDVYVVLYDDGSYALFSEIYRKLVQS